MSLGREALDVVKSNVDHLIQLDGTGNVIIASNAAMLMRNHVTGLCSPTGYAELCGRLGDEVDQAAW